VQLPGLVVYPVLACLFVLLRHWLQLSVLHVVILAIITALLLDWIVMPWRRIDTDETLDGPTRMSNQSKLRKILTCTGIVVLLVLLAVRTFFIGYYHISQNGMYPGLPVGSAIFTAKRAYSDISGVKRGDIIVFVQEENGRRHNYVRRVVALPGEKVVASGESLVVDGQKVQRQQVREVDGTTVFREQIGDISYEIAFDQSPASQPPDVSVTIPADRFFVMGDNRFDARDSRYFGTVPFSSIIGKKL
jgi:signal peptidase I